LTFNDFVMSKYPQQHAMDIINRVNWTEWVQVPGPIPANAGINFETDQSRAFQSLADEYIKLGGRASPANIDIYKNEEKDVNLKVVFHNQLLEK
jgi:hypothetical protein